MRHFKGSSRPRTVIFDIFELRLGTLVAFAVIVCNASQIVVRCWLQRLHRIITSEELVSPHHSAREMIEVVRNRDFAKLFQKSVRKVRGITRKLPVNCIRSAAVFYYIPI